MHGFHKSCLIHLIFHVAFCTVVQSNSEKLFSKIDVKNLQINRIPNSHDITKETSTIFELVMLSQLQHYVEDKLGSQKFQEPFWVSTSFLKNLLDSSGWNMKKAKLKFKKAIEKRTERLSNSSQIPEDLFHNFYVDIHGYDQEGCPIIILPVGDWQTYRSYLEKEKSFPKVDENLKNYFVDVIEQLLYQVHKRNDSECSQFSLIADMERYTALHTTGIKAFITTIKLFEKYYPGVLKIAYIINSTNHFLRVAQTFKSSIPWEIRRKTFIYTDKKYWKDALLQNIDMSQLSPKYGGSNFFFLD